MYQQDMQQWCWEYLTTWQAGWPVTGMGGWLTGDGNDRCMTACSGQQQHSVWGVQFYFYFYLFGGRGGKCIMHCNTEGTMCGTPSRACQWVLMPFGQYTL